MSGDISRHSLDVELCYQLAALIAASEMRSRRNLNDIPVECEDYLIPLLEWVYQLGDGQLKNANQDKSNQAGYDLICESKHAVFQVTATKSKKKIVHTIRETMDALEANHKDVAFIYEIVLHTQYKPKNSVKAKDPLSKGLPGGGNEEALCISIPLGDDTDEGTQQKGNLYILDANALYDRITHRLVGDQRGASNIREKGAVHWENGASTLLTELKDVTGIKEYTHQVKSLLGLGNETPVQVAKRAFSDDEDGWATLKGYLMQQGMEDEFDNYKEALCEFMAVSKTDNTRERFADSLTQECSIERRYGLNGHDIINRTNPSGGFDYNFYDNKLNRTTPEDGEINVSYSSEGAGDVYSLLIAISEFKHEKDDDGKSESYKDQLTLQRISSFIKKLDMNVL